jgi:uncharacterized protein (TIGR02145 family)
MKQIKLFGLLSIALLFSQCKTVAPTAPNGPAPSVLEVSAILDSAQSNFIQYLNWNGGNAAQAIQLTTDWLQQQPNVSNAFTLDSVYITIQLKSGLETYFYFEDVDDSGYAVTRGGGSKDDANEIFDPQPIFSPAHISSPASTPATNIITNKKVLIFAAGAGEGLNLEPQIARTTSHLANSGLGITLTVLRGVQCSEGVVSTFKDYGLVILDTHGMPDGFLVGSHLDLSSTPTTDAALKSLMDAQVGAGTSDKVASGGLVLAAKVIGNSTKPGWQQTIDLSKQRSFFYPAKSVNALPAMPNTIVFGNMCYSGFTLGNGIIPAHIDTFPNRIYSTVPARQWNVDGGVAICTAFQNRGLISYYGYVRDNPSGTSRPVPDDFAIGMEDSLVTRLMKGDSTGIANLASDNVTEFIDPPHLQERLRGNLNFRHFGANDYSYAPNCIDSFYDARDGQLYHAVCIGKQTWMKENLNYDIPGADCYDSLATNCDIYGKLYSRSQAMNGSASSSSNPSGVQGICPNGWHVPSAAEWMQLVNYLGDTLTAGGSMKSTNLWSPDPNGGATNRSGFSALPGGEFVDGFQATYRDFYSQGSNGFFHTATTLYPNQVSVMALWNNSTQAKFLTYPAVTPPIEAGNVSCRCVKDP